MEVAGKAVWDQPPKHKTGSENSRKKHDIVKDDNCTPFWS
jgi:hypothetical protein